MNSCLLREKRSALVNSVTARSLTEGLIGVTEMRILKWSSKVKREKGEEILNISRIVRLKESNVKIILTMCVWRKATAYNLISIGLWQKLSKNRSLFLICLIIIVSNKFDSDLKITTKYSLYFVKNTYNSTYEEQY